MFQIDEEHQRVFAAAIAQAQTEHHLMGLGGAVAVDGVEVASSTSGQTKRRGRALVSTDLWHIGSVTKPMTATLVGLLIEDGLLGLETRIVDVLPAFEGAIDVSWAAVTVHHLLTHTHGGPVNLPKSIHLSRSRLPDELIAERLNVIGSILAKPLERVPGDMYEYSNFGFVLVGHIAEQLLGQSYEELMVERVFEPLSMSSVGFGAPPEGGPVGHRQLSRFTVAVEPGKKTPADNGPAMSAAGRAHMTLSDLLRFGHDHMLAVTGQPGSLLANDTAIQLTRCSPASEAAGYACGWGIHDRGHGRVMSHNGSNTMWVTLLSMFPERGVVFALATNVGDLERSEQAFADVTAVMLDDPHAI